MRPAHYVIRHTHCRTLTISFSVSSNPNLRPDRRRKRVFTIPPLAMASVSVSMQNAQSKTVVTGYPLYNIAVGYPAAIYTAATASSLPPHSYCNRRAAHHVTWKSFTCRLLSAVIVFLLAIAMACLVTWLVLRPRLPEFDVISASVSPLNVTVSRVTATWDFTILVRNPNEKLRVYYDNLEGLVMYGVDDVVIFATHMPALSQDEKNETTVEMRSPTVWAYVGKEVAKGISNDLVGGRVSFGFKVFAGVRFRVGNWWTRRQLLRVYCDGIKFGFTFKNATGNGKMLGESRVCEVYL